MKGCGRFFKDFHPAVPAYSGISTWVSPGGQRTEVHGLPVGFSPHAASKSQPTATQEALNLNCAAASVLEAVECFTVKDAATHELNRRSQEKHGNSSLSPRDCLGDGRQ